MLNKKITIIALCLYFLIGIEAFSQTPKPLPPEELKQYMDVTIEEVLANPKKYDEKYVILEGKVKEFKYTTSSKGEPFTIFKLIDSDKNEVRVYYEDEHLPFTIGDQVKIMGKFWKQKRYFLYKIKNVIKARRAYIL